MAGLQEAGSRRRGWSVRGRVLAGLLAIITPAFAAPGSSDYLLQVTGVEARIDDSLRGSVRESRVPAANKAIATSFPTPISTAQLLHTLMRQKLPSPPLGMLRIIGDTIRWTAPEVVVLPPQDDPEFPARAEGNRGWNRCAYHRYLRPWPRATR